MIYIPIDVKYPINTKKDIKVQIGTTNNLPEILFELHDCCDYFDLGDTYSVSAAITNTYNKTTKATGQLTVTNPHRGQIIFQPSVSDFTETGIHTITVKCNRSSDAVSFQTTIFVQSVSDDVLSCL